MRHCLLNSWITTRFFVIPTYSHAAAAQRRLMNASRLGTVAGMAGCGYAYPEWLGERRTHPEDGERVAWPAVCRRRREVRLCRGPSRSFVPYPPSTPRRRPTARTRLLDRLLNLLSFAPSVLSINST